MEFNTGGTADSSNSGAMTGGTMASSMYKNGGRLKPIPKGNKGLPKLPKSVRNKMGYMAKGGGVGKMEWGGTAESSETGEFIGGENQSSMFENGGVSTGFTYDIGGL